MFKLGQIQDGGDRVTMLNIENNWFSLTEFYQECNQEHLSQRSDCYIYFYNIDVSTNWVANADIVFRCDIGNAKIP